MQNLTKKTINNQAYWYRLYVGECPVCGRDKSYRVREFGPRPVDRNDRVVYMTDSECYDHCESC